MKADTGRTPYDDTGRDLKCCSYKPRNPKSCWQATRSQGGAGRDSLLQASEGAWHCPHLDLGLLISRTERQ